MWLHAEIQSLADIPRFYGNSRKSETALTAGSRRRSFSALDVNSNRIANAMIESGCAPESRVTFIGKNSIDYFEAMFATFKAQGIFVPLNWRLAAAELAQVLADAQPTLFLVDHEFSQLARRAYDLAGCSCEMVEFDSTTEDASLNGNWASHASTADPRLPVLQQSTAIILYTSGTTGRPKGVQLSHRAFDYMRLSEHLDAGFEWRDDDMMLMVMPNFHLVGMGLSIQALYNGASLLILPAMDPEAVLHAIQRNRPSICCLVPTAIHVLLSHAHAEQTDFSSIRLVTYAGSRIESSLLKRAQAMMRCEFLQFYGATETWTITLLRPHQHDVTNEERMKSCGTPPPLVDLKVVDTNNCQVADGTVGELLVRSPTLFSGYWNQQEATKSALADGWYRTGDAAYRSKDDGLYYLVDRVKDMIISGGENIYSIEVEQALLKHPAVVMAAAIGCPDPMWGERVVGYVVLAPDCNPSKEDLLVFCRNETAGYKVPKELHIVDALPMTSIGKVMKRALREQHIAASNAKA
jgi:acyl-CoA synthetase (AMP-forming)/AMP-acid ligase II